MLKTKLNITKFPMLGRGQWDQYIECAPGINVDDLDPCFIGRLAALSKYVKENAASLRLTWKKLRIISGYRSDESQAKIFLARGGKYDAKLGYYWPDSVPAEKRTVAKPGKSWHGKRLAIDTDTPWAKILEKNAAFAGQAILSKFGLCKPMTRGNKSLVLEDWHFQPSETINVPVEKRAALAPIL